MNVRFDEQKVLVVGGSSGIGEATAQAFAGLGAKVTIGSRSVQKLQAVADRIGGNLTTAVLDITDQASVDAFVAQTEWDHVVISAAQTPMGGVRGMALADAYGAMDSKFWGAYRVARGVQIRAGGSLTLVSGFLSVRPANTAVLQGAINAALEALARGLALELSPVRVNTVSPGMIDTPIRAKMEAKAREKLYRDTAARLPTQCVGLPEDVARAVIYLASCAFASGSTVLVDGGGAIV